MDDSKRRVLTSSEFNQDDGTPPEETTAATAEEFPDIPDGLDRRNGKNPELQAAAEAAAAKFKRLPVPPAPRESRRWNGKGEPPADSDYAKQDRARRIAALHQDPNLSPGQRRKLSRAIRKEATQKPKKAGMVPADNQQEKDVMRSKTKSAKANARKAVKGKTEAREGSKLEKIVKLLKRDGGCTTADVLKATDWPSVSMPQQAKAAGITLKKEKVEGVYRYSAA